MALLSTLTEGASATKAAPGGATLLQSGPASPVAEDMPGPRAGTRGTAQDMYFFTSIEDFPPNTGDLGLTHDDVQGFYDYIRQFSTPNAWYRDGSVGQWIYEETYDNYLDDYGFDAARVVYHSGHGSMDGNGVFWLPVGNDWGGDTWTSSNDMRLGNEQARYAFWSTCLSLRVKDGHTPFRTWSTANLGLRMIFGYETTSVDSGDYGKFFFEEWNSGKSFSTAFLDASWRISTAQEPSVAACGATQAEATDRLFNERVFNGDRADTAWWWWRWYNAARARTRNVRIPDGARSAKLAPAVASHEDLAAWAERFDVPVPPDARERGLRHGIIFGGKAGARVAVDPGGAREVWLAETSDTRRQIGTEQAVTAAQRAVEQYRLAENVDLVLDRIRYDRHAGQSADERVDDAVREITVDFVQVIDGVPVVGADGGRVHVRVDNEGTVTGISDSTHQVRDLRDQPAVPPQPESRKSRAPRPSLAGSVRREGENGVASAGGAAVDQAIDEALDTALQRRLQRIASGGRFPGGIRTVPDTTEVGYALRDGDAVLVARREVEFDFGQGLAKRYVLAQPIDG
ncbi:DUF6345 domain-containing protein [Dactylosporangium sp. NPDC005572]|uniref:DUF6345 domain-containing protein n=1 Tax=Dactylosporangium sp. NPDC005572 TaxID=3156889 RepID=UPI0033AAE359